MSIQKLTKADKAQKPLDIGLEKLMTKFDEPIRATLNELGNFEAYDYAQYHREFVIDGTRFKIKLERVKT